MVEKNERPLNGMLRLFALCFSIVIPITALEGSLLSQILGSCIGLMAMFGLTIDLDK